MGAFVCEQPLIQRRQTPSHTAGGAPAPHVPPSSSRWGPRQRTPSLRSLGPGPGLLRPLGGVTCQAQHQWHCRYGVGAGRGQSQVMSLVLSPKWGGAEGRPWGS